MVVFVNKLDIIIRFSFWTEFIDGIHTYETIDIYPGEIFETNRASLDEYIIRQENYKKIGKFRCCDKWHTGKFECDKYGVWSVKSL